MPDGRATPDRVAEMIDLCREHPHWQRRERIALEWADRATWVDKQHRQTETRLNIIMAMEDAARIMAEAMEATRS